MALPGLRKFSGRDDCWGSKKKERTRVEGLWFVEFWDVYGLFEPQPRGPDRMTSRMSVISSALRNVIQQEMKERKSNSLTPSERLQQWFSLWLDHVETREHRSLQGDIKPQCLIVLSMILESKKRSFITHRKERGEQKMNADNARQGDWHGDRHEEREGDWPRNWQGGRPTSWYEPSSSGASQWQKKKKR